MTDKINIAAIGSKTIHIPIVGTSPLIVHRFSEKAKKQMLDAQQGVKTPKEPRDPQKEYEDAHYYLKDGRCGVPATAFKGAMVSGARFFGKDVSMVLVKQTIFVHGETGKPGHGQLVAIEGESYMVEDVVRINNGKSTDLRYRPYFDEWRAIVPVTYVEASFTQDSVVSLLDAAGLGVGIGEWRPGKSGGPYGQFRIDETREVVTI